VTPADGVNAAVRLALDQSSELNHAVVHLLTLVQIRDAMVDKRDRYVLQRYASAQIVHLANLSRLTTESVALVLTKVRQPGIAIDVARLRDLSMDVHKSYASCDVPKLNQPK
jgi:hypothetical protein